MTTADQTAKEQYEKQFTEPLLSEEAVMLLDPSTVKSELSYYEHGYDRITFTIKGLEYSIPGCLPTLPTLYFVGFNRIAVSGNFAEFQTIEHHDFDDSVLSIFKMIILDRLLEKVENTQTKSVNPKTTMEALDYIGLSDEAQTNVLRLRFPREQPAEFMLRQLVMRHAVRWAFRYEHRRLSVLTLNIVHVFS